jgi:aminoglycoside phosphotransferase (APT) family kinase protein
MAEGGVVQRPLPEESLLVDRLTAVLEAPVPVQILSRKEKQSGTFPKEVVSCVLADGRQIQLFCKYSAPRFGAFEHRRGVLYEAEIYRRLLVDLPLTVPTFVGSHEDVSAGEAWLMLVNLEGAVRSRREWHLLPLVAAWLGEFHRLHEGAESRDDLDFMIRYDAAYYEGWAARTELYSQHLHETHPWLPVLCRHMPAVVPMLTAAPQTVVHGEYTVNNIMIRDGEVFPTDWESAAIGFGEIDLVCLVDNWPEDTVAACTEAYVTARWPEERPVDVELRMLAAELYLQMRWLGEDPAALHADVSARLGRLHTIARAMGIGDS